MTIEERIARIENVLIAEGKLSPVPGPTHEQGIADLLKGDNSTLYAYFLANPDHWKEPPPRVWRRSNNTKAPGPEKIKAQKRTGGG